MNDSLSLFTQYVSIQRKKFADVLQAHSDVEHAEVPVDSPHAQASAAVRRTISLGKYDDLLEYETAVIEMGISMPCRPVDVDVVSAAAMRYVVDRVGEEEADLIAGIREARNARRRKA